jgi:2-methylcitrate dehydratase PrpD
MTIARDLAAFLAGLTIDDLPAQPVEHAAMLIASTLASAAAGRSIDSARIIRDLARDRGGSPQASVWFDSGVKLPAIDAAQANAVMSDAAASDDSDLRAIVHCGTPLVSTSLALAERTGASGADVLAAIVLGYEAAGRISGAVTPSFRDRGFHGCLGAIFAASVAAGRVLRLDAPRLAQTVALSATSIGGLMAAANTSTAREYHAGLAVWLGIHAAMSAERGYQAEESILETREGFVEVYGGNDPTEITRELGRDWDIVTDMAIKLVPGGHPYHALAEASANAARDGNIKPDEIDTIMVSRPGMTRLSGPLHPADLIDMAHSPAYFVAAGAADHEFTWAHCGPAKIADSAIHRLIDKVQVGPPPTENVERYRQGATVTIRTTDGRTSTNTVFAPKGSGLLGIAWSDVDRKYRTLMPLSGMADARIEASLTLIHDFRRAPNVSPDRTANGSVT